jgi:hypothetical protein
VRRFFEAFEQQYVGGEIDPVGGQRQGFDADIVRASELQHAVEDMDRHTDFSHPTFVYT